MLFIEHREPLGLIAEKEVRVPLCEVSIAVRIQGD